MTQEVKTLINGMDMTTFRRKFMTRICSDDAFASAMVSLSLDGIDADALGSLVAKMRRAGIPAEELQTEDQILEAITAIGSKAPREWRDRFKK